MAKRIAFFSDGTWDGASNNTNVYKLYKGAQVSADQIPFYDDGVGTDGTPIDKLSGGLWGDGLGKKIRDGYSKISQVYQEGDRLFLFGFSRGAYTARSLAGMIAVCGLPTKDFNDGVVETAFQAYRSPAERPALLKQLNESCDLFDAKITMIGVWDTVGSLGIPAIIGKVDPIRYGFLDTGLHPDVLNAYHAMAIDERRCEFPATLWTSQAPGQTVEQVWFTGVHCDIGGSYPGDPDGTALSDITLAWMLNKAAALGMTFAADVEAKYTIPMPAKCALDTAHESWSRIWGFPAARSIAADASLANSVVVRCGHNSSYKPSNVSFTNGQLAQKYRIVNVVAPEPAGSQAAAKSAGG